MSTLRIRPKLVVDGADDAIAFYADVLDARTTSRFTMGDHVVFAQLEVPGGATLQLKDADETDPAPRGTAAAIVDIECNDPDAVMRRALAHGAEAIFDVADQPYGSRQGRFRDPFGYQWIVGTPITMSDEEVQAALDAWS